MMWREKSIVRRVADNTSAAAWEGVRGDHGTIVAPLAAEAGAASKNMYRFSYQ